VPEPEGQRPSESPGCSRGQSWGSWSEGPKGACPSCPEPSPRS